MSDKSLLTRLGETIDQYHRDRQASQTIPATAKRYPQLLSWRWWLPTPGNVLFTMFVIASLLWAQNVGAISLDAPLAATTSTAGIPYQGRLANSSGQPLTQTVNMIFRLYAAASGGSPLWEEQWTGANSVQVSDGLFNVMLGSLTPIQQSVIIGNSNLFLGITVGTDSEMLPRVQLGSVPFATQALTVPDGSITKAKLSSDISLSNTTLAVATLSPAFQSTANSAVDVGNLLTSINLPTASDVQVNFQYRVQKADTNYYRVYLLRDGNIIYGSDTHFNTPGVHDHRSISFLDTNVPAGTHTYKVQMNPLGQLLYLFDGSQLSITAFSRN